MTDKAKIKSLDFADTAIKRILHQKSPDTFSIRSIVKDFQNDKSIKEIKGIQIDYNFLFVEYCVYTGKKSRVLKGVNSITPKKVNDYTSDDKCYSVTHEAFYNNIARDEDNSETAFFWDFEKLKKYEVYTCIKAPLRHYIIFDSKSDTVYHRIEELRE